MMIPLTGLPTAVEESATIPWKRRSHLKQNILQTVGCKLAATGTWRAGMGSVQYRADEENVSAGCGRHDREFSGQAISISKYNQLEGVVK